MSKPIKMPAPPLGTGQVSVKLGLGGASRRYVLNPPHPVGCPCEECVRAAARVLAAHNVQPPPKI